jgi:hypothetical protein
MFAQNAAHLDVVSFSPGDRGRSIASCLVQDLVG